MTSQPSTHFHESACESVEDNYQPQHSGPAATQAQTPSKDVLEGCDKPHDDAAAGGIEDPQPCSSHSQSLSQELDRAIHSIQQHGLGRRDRYGRFASKPGDDVSKKVKSVEQKERDKVSANVTKMKNKAVKLLGKIQEEMYVNSRS